MLSKILSLIITIFMMTTSVPTGAIPDNSDVPSSAKNATVASVITENEKEFVVTENARNPQKTMSMEFDFECTANYTKKSTAELFFGIDVDGLHEIGSSYATYSYDDSRSNKDREWKFLVNATTGNFNYDDGEETGTNANKIYGKFYLDQNKSNSIGKKYGATSINSIDFYFYNIDDDEERPDYERLDFSVSDTTYFDYEMASFLSNKGSYLRMDLKLYEGYEYHDYAVEYPGVSVEPTPSTSGTKVTYTLKGHSKNKESTGILGTTEAEINATITYDITYISVNSTKLWNLYNYEVNTLKRISSAYDSSTWSAYQSALSNAENVLCGGVPQATIDSAYTTLENAVTALKARVNYNTNGATTGTVTTPQYYKIYSGISVNASAVTAPLYTFETINLTECSHLAKTGYKCTGWSKSGTATTGEIQTELTHADLAVANGPTFYAVWSPITYTVNYNANPPSGISVTGSVKSQTCLYDSSYNANANGFIAINYRFAGWNTNAAGTGSTYQPGATFKNLTATDGAIVNLYAVWEADTTNILFKINLPSGVTETTSGFSEDTIKALIIGSTNNIFTGEYKLTAEGYEHIGWSANAGATTAAFTENYTVPSSAQTLYAVWQKKNITVSYITNGGILADEGFTANNETVQYGDIVDLPDEDQILRSGYTLTGWRSSIADASGKTFFAKGSDYTVSDASGTVLFTAEWLERDTVYILHHNNVVGTDYTTTIEGKYNSALDSSKFITPEVMKGYTFTGWYVKGENGYTEYTVPSTYPADDVELYAGWSMDALSAQIQRFPSDIDSTAVYSTTGQTVYYYKEPGRTDAKNMFESASKVYNETDGVLYDYARLYESNDATENLMTAINALVEEPADYSVVDAYRTYYYEMTNGLTDDDYADSHTYNYNGTEYQVTKETFTDASFNEFKNAVDAVVNGKGIKNQSEIDSYAKALKESYNNLVLKKAEYSEFDSYLNEAKSLNTIVGEDDGTLDEYLEDTWGILWYDEGSWYTFFEVVMIYNIELPRDLTILEQSEIDNAVADLQVTFEGLMLNPADYSVYDENGYATQAESVYNDASRYQDTYRSDVLELWRQIDNTRGQLSFKYDQDKVDEMIESLADLLANPQYKFYELIFKMNDGTNTAVKSTVVDCVASLKGLAPEDPEREGYVFIGWYTLPEDTVDETGMKIDFETTEEEMGTSDRIIYARWVKEEIKTEPIVSILPGSTVVIDADYARNLGLEETLIYGLAEYLTDLSDYITVENGTIEYTYVDGYDGQLGTGTVVTVKDLDGNVFAEYTVVIFGDYNGDGIVDSEDTGYFTSIANFELFDHFEKAHLYAAADVNADGSVDSMDEADMYAVANYDLAIVQYVTEGSHVVEW